MATFTTKYDIGEKVFYVSNVYDGRVEVLLGEIKNINVSGKVWDRYELNSIVSRAESNLYKNFEDAKKEALREQTELNNNRIELIKNGKEPREVR